MVNEAFRAILNLAMQKHNQVYQVTSPQDQQIRAPDSKPVKSSA